MVIQNKITFPKYNDNYKNTLNIGFTNDKYKKDINNKVLAILDITGSMGEYLNETSDCTKYITAKKILTKLQDGGYEIDIMPFNTKPYDICKIEDIPQPDQSTHMTPLVPELDRIFKTGAKYGAVIFISDGLPTEPKPMAHEAIRTLGNLTREAGANPVSLAIGTDADGEACALFSGNRGYECFIKYLSKMEELIEDIKNGINCNYIHLDNGNFIPVESTGKYFYLEKTNFPVSPVITVEQIMKFLNLTILSEFSKSNPNYEELHKLIDITTEVMADKGTRDMIAKHFKDMVKIVVKQNADLDKTPSAITARKYGLRTASQQV